MSGESKALKPIEQRQVIFYEDEITAVVIHVDDKQEVYVPVRPLCDYLGIDWAGQRQRIMRDPVMSTSVKIVVITPTKSRRGNPNMLCLPLPYLPGWLFGISVNRVKSEFQDKIIRYQRECFEVLWEAFQEGRLTAEPAFNEILQTDSPAVQTYKMMLAMTQLARNQVLMEARLIGRLDDHEQRLEQLETTVGDPGHHVTPDQASQISQAVKAVALEMSKRSGRNEYGGVYGELYRQFGITSYKLLPANKFEEAMEFLSNWHGSITGKEPF